MLVMFVFLGLQCGPHFPSFFFDFYIFLFIFRLIQFNLLYSTNLQPVSYQGALEAHPGISGYSK